MSHCPRCDGGPFDDEITCPGCGHEAEMAALRKVSEAAKPMLCASLDSQQRVYDIKRLSSALAAWEGVRG